MHLVFYKRVYPLSPLFCFTPTCEITQFPMGVQWLIWRGLEPHKADLLSVLFSFNIYIVKIKKFFFVNDEKSEKNKKTKVYY